MERSIRNRWVSALLSGDYQQADGRLNNRKAGHCCLGVLCEVVGVPVDSRDAAGDALYQFPTDEVSYTSLPEMYREQIGLADTDMDTLISMNDEGKDFNTIAMWILRNV